MLIAQWQFSNFPFLSQMPPSEFIRLMKMSTEERLQATKQMHSPKITQLLDMAENTLQKFSDVDVDNALFQPFPSEIYFQNFEPTMTYEVALTLRNNDSVSKFWFLDNLSID